MKTLQRLLRHRSAQVGGLVVAVTLVVALLAPVLAPEGYDDQQLSERLSPPSKEWLCGTDQMGRSILSRLIWGARISLQVGALSVLISLIVGGVLGLIAGYYGGVIDRLIMGVMDVLLAFPGILLAIAVVAILGPGLTNVMIAVGVSRVPQFARLLRGSTLSAKEHEYVEAQHALGASTFRILVHHILPNVIAPVIVIATLNTGTAILAAAGLSFIGLGAQPPIPDWGSMVSEGRSFLRSAWWVAVLPGMAILFTILGFNLLGDGFRDALDPRIRL
jgi:peptide/nickel transport system permease protein